MPADQLPTIHNLQHFQNTENILLLALDRTDLTPQKASRPRVDDDDSEGASTAMEPDVDSNVAGIGASADGETGDAAAVERGSGEAAAVG